MFRSVGPRQREGKTTKINNPNQKNNDTYTRTNDQTSRHLWYVALDIIKPPYAVAYLQFKSKSQ